MGAKRARTSGVSTKGPCSCSSRTLGPETYANCRTNIIERSVIVCETEIFTVDESWLSQPPLDTRSGDQLFLSKKVAATERETIEEALRESQGRISGPSGAAAKLGIAPSTLDSKIRSLNINKNRF